MSLSTFSELGLELQPSSAVLRSANKTGLEVLGQVQCLVKFSNESILDSNCVISFEDSEETILNYTPPRWRDDVDCLHCLTEMNQCNVISESELQKKDNSFLITFIVVKELSVPALIGMPTITRLK